MPLRSFLLFLGVVLVLCGLYSLTGAQPSPPEGKTIINVWHPWVGNDGEDFRKLVDRFNQTHDKLFVRSLFVPNNLSSNQKLFLSISAGLPPDCTFVDGPQVCEWAARHAIEPIDDLMAANSIRKEEFWDPCWKQTQFLNQTYALTFCADPNFALFWNRSAFQEAGLLDAGPPKTIEEMDQIANRLTVTDEKGRLRRVGFVPWNVFGYANSIFTWGWAFGGEFYDPATDRITCGDDPHILEAVQWMMTYADQYGFEKINSFVEGFGDQADTPFVHGMIAMAAGHVSNPRMIKKYAPNLDYGAVHIPYPARMGSDQSAWMGGWCLSIPRGSRHPEAAFEFMKWLCTSPDAGETMIRTMGTFPAYKNSPAFASIGDRPELAVLYDVLKNTRHQRPVIPAQGFYMGALDRAVNEILNRIRTPKEALMKAQQDTQKELDRVMAPFKKTR